MDRVLSAVRGFASGRALLVVSFSVTVVTCSIFVSQAGSSAEASSSSEYASYPALNSTAPSGLPLVSSRPGAGEPRPTGPTWPLEAPEGTEGAWPMGSSIRAVPVQDPDLSVWIAKSDGGGICVLLSRHQAANEVPSVAYSCSTEGLSRGATTELSQTPGAPSTVYVAGVVPTGVSSVKATLADGSVETVPVTDGAWALETTAQPLGYQTIAGGQ